MSAWALPVTAAVGCTLFLDTNDLSGTAGTDGSATESSSNGDGAPSDSSTQSDGGGGDAASDATCSDTMTNPNHCGVCGHSCLGGTCTGGRCDPAIAVSGQDGPIGITNDGVDLYWSLQGGTVRAMPLAGGAVRFVTTVPEAAHLDIRGADVIIAGYGSKHIYRAPKIGGAHVVIATCDGECLGVATDETRAFFTDRGQNQRLLEVLADGGALPLAGGFLSVEDAVVLGGQIFVASEGQSSVFTVPKGGGNAVLFAQVDDVVAVAVDEKDAWLVSQSPGKILRRSTTGNTALETMASGQTQPAGITLTPQAVYWANYGTGSIMKLAR